MPISAQFEAALEAALSHLLQGHLPSADNPLALGFSGGGDSTALLYGLRKFAKHIDVFCVDHNLRAGSADEAMLAQARARAWGFKADILTWKTAPMSSGLQDKARRARYGLIGAAMRERGIAYLLTGHTEDDQAETCLMRYDRGTDWRGAAGMAPRVYAPVWPELARASVLRPLLCHSREDLRRYNRACGLKWSEDPSNTNRSFTRIRARDYLKHRPSQRRLMLGTAREMSEGRRAENIRLKKWFELNVQVSAYGFIEMKAVPPREALLHILRISAGQGHMIDGVALERLKGAMATRHFKGATLGGAQIIRKANGFLCVRDPVMAKGRRGQGEAMAKQSLTPGHHIWDGRFYIHNRGSEAVEVKPAWGHIEAVLDKFPILKQLPAEARPSLPLITSNHGEVICLGHEDRPNIQVKALCHERLFQTFQI